MAKRKKIEELSQSHGMEQKFIPSTLEQVWGDEGLSKYGTMDEEVYSDKIISSLAINKSKIGIGIFIVEISDKNKVEIQKLIIN